MNTIERIIEQDVLVLANQLVEHLARDNQYIEEILNVCVKDDLSELPQGFTINIVNGDYELYQDCGDDEPEFIDAFGEEREAVRESYACIGEEPPVIEALQHWLVSGWLADKLEQVGAMVVRDVLGFHIWGRSDYGQCLTLNADLQAVAKLLDSD